MDFGLGGFNQLNLYEKSNEECYMKVFMGEAVLQVNFLTYCFVNPIGRRF